MKQFVLSNILYRLFNLYKYSGSFLSVRIAFLLFLSSLTIGTIGYITIEDFTFIEGIYMSIITISTVGFNEVHPLSPIGEIFTSCLIILNIGIFTYTISTFTAFIIQGEFFKKLHMNAIERGIGHLKDHIILCGYGKYGKEIADHFLKAMIPFVVIEKDDSKVEVIQKSTEKILYIQEDATHDDVMQRAGIQRAKALISALPDDSDNLFTVFTARQLNPDLNIISRALSPKAEGKLKKAGANHVIMPDQIGGFYMFSLINKPDAVEFFSFITNEYESNIRFEEIHYKDLPESFRSLSQKELRLREQTGANIIGYRDSKGKFIVNPHSEIVMEPGSSYILLGTDEQLGQLRKLLNGKL